MGACRLTRRRRPDRVRDACQLRGSQVRQYRDLRVRSVEIQRERGDGRTAEDFGRNYRLVIAGESVLRSPRSVSPGVEGATAAAQERRNGKLNVLGIESGKRGVANSAPRTGRAFDNPGGVGGER